MSIGGSTRPPGGRSATVTTDDAVAFVQRAATIVRRHEALLDRLDAALGDGDHGTNLAIGLDAVLLELHERPPGPDEEIGALIRRIGHVIVASVGGASGPLYGTAFIECGFALEGHGAVDLATLAAAIDTGAAGLARRGRCVVGDKTILDALRPAADALTKMVTSGESPQDAFVAAARAARRGAQSTIPMIARRGLALRLGERSRGHRDPGATSCFLLIRAMLDGRSAARAGRMPRPARRESPPS